MDQHRTTDTWRINRETNEGNEGDTGGATETMMRKQDGRGQTIDSGAHGTNNKQQAMCSTHRDIWWPAQAHQQDRDKNITCFGVIFVGRPMLRKVTVVLNFLHLYTICLTVDLWSPNSLEMVL